MFKEIQQFKICGPNLMSLGKWGYEIYSGMSQLSPGVVLHIR